MVAAYNPAARRAEYLRSRETILAGQKHRDDARRAEKRAENHALARRPTVRYRRFVARAQKRGVPCEISFEQWRLLVLCDARCHYCDGPMPDTGCGLDRVDCRDGYVLANVVPCCGWCNVAKGMLLTHDELVQVIARRRSNGWTGWTDPSLTGLAMNRVEAPSVDAPASQLALFTVGRGGEASP